MMSHDSRFGSPIDMEQISRRPSASSLPSKTGDDEQLAFGVQKGVPHSVDGDEEDFVKHVLLAEFDIDQGATLSLQYPSPTGTDEQ
jgi:hypothetical protein